MASITKFIQKLSPLGSKKPIVKYNEEIQSKSNNWENFLMEIQKVLLWDDPFHSCVCVISVNIVFWLIIYLEFKFYGIIFAALFILTFEQLWQEHISQFFINKSEFENPASDVPKVLKNRNFSTTEMKALLKKFQTVINNTFVRTRLFRQTQPGRFCILTCMCFLWLSFLGESISGITILYFLLMFIMIVPGVLIHFLPPYVINSITNLIYSSRKVSENDESEFDELKPYLPETSTEALELLKLASDIHVARDDDEESNDILLEKISGCTSDTKESIRSKLLFYPESASMPSPENSMDFLEFDLPSGEKFHINENQTSDINFQTKHFDGNSSSEEDFINGLNISETKKNKSRKQEPKQEETVSLLNAENLISIGANLLASGFSKKNLTKESSSDTDSFEMISDEEI